MESEISSFNRALYTLLLDRGTLNAARDSIRESLPKKSDSIGILTSEFLYALGFRSYVRDQCEGAGVRERMIAFLAKAQEQLNIDPIQGARLAQNRIKELNDRSVQRETFEQSKKMFFMHDKYPNNPRLPNPTFDQVMQLSPPEND